jgi:Ca-activated chloride channel homolog
MTDLKVNITGQIAQTTVYQEFINESDKPVSAVYSFPLPPNARATGLYFWSNDTMYRAVLKVQEQAVNPGTGEGGIDAALNAYLGPNSIRMLINDIPASKVQRVQIEYISFCDYFQGTTRYRYPLDTKDYALYPVELLSISFQISSIDTIRSAALLPLPGVSIKQPDLFHSTLTAEYSKIYLTQDLFFSYTSLHSKLGAEFYGVANDSMDGHFVMVVKPSVGTYSSDVLPKHVVFVIDRSSDMFGTTLDEAKSALGECIKKLNSTDDFTLLTFDWNVNLWKSTLVSATTSAKDSAVQFLSGLTLSYGANLQTALQQALTLFPSDTIQKLIVLFSDGRADVDPAQIHGSNMAKVSIIPIVSSASAGKQRLEMMAYLNYGFPLMVNPFDPLKGCVLEMFDRISYPVLKDVRFEIGTSAYSILPMLAPSLFKSSVWYFAGRYKNPGNAILSVGGYAPAGALFYDFPLTFPSRTDTNTFAEKFWAKEKIDDIERRIAVYGPNDSLKNELISISLKYRMRCKYTAYLSEKTDPVPGGAATVEQALEFTSTEIRFTEDGVQLSWIINPPSLVKELRIYRQDFPELPYSLIAIVNGSERSYVDKGNKKEGSTYRLDIVGIDGTVLKTTYLNIDKNVPRFFTLFDNFPNPFNPTTTIAFELPLTSFVSLKVYNVLGQAITTLVHEKMNRGYHSIQWEGINSSGTQLSSGIYIYELCVNDFVARKKMLMVK